MKTLSLIALLLVSSLARAADDAPLDSVIVPKEQRIQEGKAMAACLATNQSLTKDNVVVSKPAFIAIVVTVALSSIALGVGVTVFATAPKQP